MSNWNKDNTIALIISLVIHGVLLALLFFVIIPRIEYEESGGVLVNVGDIDMAAGTFTPTPIEAIPEEPAQQAPNLPSDQEEMLTQESEEAPSVPATPVKPQKRETPKPKQNRTQEDLQKVQRQREEEARRKQEAEAKRRRDAINKSVSAAFGTAGKGSGDAQEGDGRLGSPDGNVDQGGLNTGVGGYGSFNLSGRSLGKGGLPRPSYTVQTEGRIVIRIVVDPSGKVISASIAPGTNIGDYSMRESAMRAARSARFNAINDINNQTGTITYTYRLR